MSQLLLNTDLFGVHVPLSDGAILASSQKKMVFFRVPLPVIYARHVALCICHVE